MLPPLTSIAVGDGNVLAVAKHGHGCRRGRGRVCRGQAHVAHDGPEGRKGVGQAEALGAELWAVTPRRVAPIRAGRACGTRRPQLMRPCPPEKSQRQGLVCGQPILLRWHRTLLAARNEDITRRQEDGGVGVEARDAAGTQAGVALALERKGVVQHRAGGRHAARGVARQTATRLSVLRDAIQDGQGEGGPNS